MLLYKSLRKIYEIFVNLLVFLSQNAKVDFKTILLVKGIPFITNKGTLVICKGVKLNSRFSANPIGGQSLLSIYVDKGAHLFIGEDCGISNSSFYCKETIRIGKGVLIGGSCKFYDTDFHSLDAAHRLSDQDTPISKPIVVEDFAFIGAHSIILKGVTIGRNSVVGAGSVVSKNLPGNQVWAGNPAKYIRDI